MAGGTAWRRIVATLAVVALATAVLGAGAVGAAPPVDVPEPPGVIIWVRTNGVDATFSFTSDIPGAASFDITTDHKQGSARFDAPAGTYTVTELGPPAGFNYGGVSGTGCSDVGSQTFEVVVTSADVTSCMVNNYLPAAPGVHVRDRG